MQENNNRKQYVKLHLIVFIWGFTGVLGALLSVEAVALVWYRMLLATIFIAVYLFISKKTFHISISSIFKFAISGVIIALHWITFFKAIKVSNISVAMVTLSTGAFFVSVLEPLFFKRKINVVEILLGIIVIFGLYIIFNVETQYITGILYALISAFLSALFSVLNGLFVKQHEPVQMSFYQLFFGVIAVTIYLGVLGGFSVSFFQLTGLDWFYLFILSSICTAWAMVASTKVMRFLTPFTVMLTINLEPIYAIVLALIIFGDKEQMQPTFYLGALIVFTVVLLNGLLKNSSLLKKKLKR